MDLKLRGKRALVTGSTAGIGFAIARGLARERAEVIVNGRSEQKVAEAIQRISSEVGSTATGVAADLSSAEGVDRLIEGAGRVDILINNAGIFEPVPFPEISDQDWFRFFELNVMSGVRLARALLPSMLQRDWGRIMFISSESGVQIPAEMVHYGVTKTAQLALSRGIAESVAGTGVTVNSVLPGPTRSEGVRGLPRQGRGRAQDRAVRGRGRVSAHHAALIADPTFRRARRGRKPRGVPRWRRLLGHNRRGATRRWRRGAQHRLAWAQPR